VSCERRIYFIFFLPILIIAWLYQPVPAYAQGRHPYEDVQTKWPQDIDIPGALSLPELEMVSRGRTQPAQSLFSGPREQREAPQVFTAAPSADCVLLCHCPNRKICLPMLIYSCDFWDMLPDDDVGDSTAPSVLKAAF
jgi:hypothetical protein